MRTASIVQRLWRLLLGMALIWGLGVGGVVALSVHHEMDEVMDSALQESAEIVYGLLSFNAGQLPLESNPGALPAPAHDESLIWQLVNEQGRVLLRSHRAPAQALAPRQQLGLFNAASAWRGYGIAYGPQQAQTLYVAQSAEHRRVERLEAVAVTVLAALAVGSLCALWLARRVVAELAPLKRLSRDVAAFQPMDAGSAIPPAEREELVPLRDAVVDLGWRLAQRVRSERTVAAHAAHALRTPLAGLAAQLAVAQRECPPEMHPRLQRARDAADRLRRVVTALLSLFRAGVDPQRQNIELQALVQSVPVDGLQVLTSGPCTAELDPDLLSAALYNLLDNSVRHGARVARVDFKQDTQQTVISLSDNGPGVSAERRAQIVAGLSQSPGSEALGLGLLLADQVARAHGGTLTLSDESPGFHLRLSFPRQPPARAA